jgi:hypothetical protein
MVGRFSHPHSKCVNRSSSCAEEVFETKRDEIIEE